VTSPDPAADGRRRADEFLALLGKDDDAAGVLLGGLSDVRDLVFLGAGLTAIARSEARSLPPAQRAQANTRQERLGFVRDANRSNPDGLRTWLRQAGEEIVLIRSQQAIADRVDAAAQERTATRAAAEANGTAAASSPATTT
jgi:TolA-binding protein